MTDFNQVYNAECYRLSFWQRLSMNLARVEVQLRSGEQLSRSDKKALKQIHKAITESYTLSERQQGYHRRQLRGQGREYLNGSEVTNASKQH